MIDFLSIAQGELGTTEIKGPQANSRILEYDACTSLKATSDEVPWCSAFANWVTQMCGVKGTNSAAARSWLDWGKCVELKDAQPGDIVILDRRDASNPNAAHVTILASILGDGWLKCVGGNQGDMVKYNNYRVERVLGIRREV